MAIVFDAPLSPDAQTAYIREVPISRGNPLLGQVPITTQYDQFFEWSEITRKNQTAEYRSFDGRIKVTERDSLAGKRVPLAPFSDSLNLGEYERLQIEFMRTGGTRDAALVDAIYRDTDKLVSNMHNRMELALGDVLSDGIFTVTGESGEFSGEADFGVPAAHKVTAGTVWTTTSAPVLDNLQAWVDLYVEANGVPPGQIIFGSNTVYRALFKNTQLINAVAGAAAQRTIITADELRGVFASYDLPTKLSVYVRQVEHKGVNVRPIDADKVILAPADLGDCLEFRFGVSATALELVDSNVAEMSFEDSPGIVGVVEKVGPPYRQFTFVDAVGMPILTDAKALLIADVAA